MAVNFPLVHHKTTSHTSLENVADVEKYVTQQSDFPMITTKCTKVIATNYRVLQNFGIDQKTTKLKGFLEAKQYS